MKISLLWAFFSKLDSLITCKISSGQTCSFTAFSVKILLLNLCSALNLLSVAEIWKDGCIGKIFCSCTCNGELHILAKEMEGEDMVTY